MAEENEENTTFITSQGIFCNSKMPFGLKNAGATYQRLVDKAFQKQIGRNLEVYVDDLVIKCCTEQKVTKDIEETFKTLREINMKLNSKKCTFGMREGMFLGYKVNADGLKIWLDKVEAILSLPSTKCLKDVQRLNGKLASLNKFMSKSAEKSLPFFKTLKKCTKKSDFHWTGEAEMAFKQMKKLIAELPMLTAPKEKEELVIYLAAAKEAVSVVLMTKMDKKQMPIYFVSRTLQGPKINYTPMEKLILALILADFIVERPDDDPPDTPIEDKEKLPDTWTLFIDGSKTSPALLKNSPSNKYLGENKKVDALSKIASTSFAHLSKQVLVEELKEKSIDEKEVLAVVEEEGRALMTPIHEYLVEEIIPEEENKGCTPQGKEANYVLREIQKRIMQHACLSQVCGGKSSKIRVLLANYARECQETDKGMQRLTESSSGITHLKTGAKTYVSTNGLVERANTSLGEAIKVRLDEGSKNWLEEISHVLWAHRTMVKSSNEETPFSLTYGTEAILPVEIGMPTLRTTSSALRISAKGPFKWRESLRSTILASFLDSNSVSKEKSAAPRAFTTLIYLDYAEGS
nr:reverse transcriptase domain-containing protein [Tanacetum cinerariifolium]